MALCVNGFTLIRFNYHWLASADPSLWDPNVYPVTWDADSNNTVWKTLYLLDMVNMFHVRVVRKKIPLAPMAVQRLN
jgi:hypothetical protein